MLTASTPGRSAMRSSSSSANRLRFSSVGYFGAAERHADDEDVVGLQSHVDALQRDKGPHRQSRAHEQHDRQRHFDDDEQIANAAALRAFPGTAARLQRVDHVWPRLLQRWCQTEHDAREHSQGDRKEQNRRVDGDPSFIRHVELGHERDDRADGAVGEQPRRPRRRAIESS